MSDDCHICGEKCKHQPREATSWCVDCVRTHIADELTKEFDCEWRIEVALNSDNSFYNVILTFDEVIKKRYTLECWVRNYDLVFAAHSDDDYGTEFSALYAWLYFTETQDQARKEKTSAKTLMQVFAEEDKKS